MGFKPEMGNLPRMSMRSGKRSSDSERGMNDGDANDNLWHGRKVATGRDAWFPGYDRHADPWRILVRSTIFSGSAESSNEHNKGRHIQADLPEDRK